MDKGYRVRRRQALLVLLVMTCVTIGGSIWHVLHRPHVVSFLRIPIGMGEHEVTQASTGEWYQRGLFTNHTGVVDLDDQGNGYLLDFRVLGSMVKLRNRILFFDRDGKIKRVLSLAADGSTLAAPATM
jgi:hypothetical protein